MAQDIKISDKTYSGVKNVIASLASDPTQRVYFYGTDDATGVANDVIAPQTVYGSAGKITGAHFGQSYVTYVKLSLTNNCSDRILGTGRYGIAGYNYTQKYAYPLTRGWGLPGSNDLKLIDKNATVDLLVPILLIDSRYNGSYYKVDHWEEVDWASQDYGDFYCAKPAMERIDFLSMEQTTNMQIETLTVSGKGTLNNVHNEMKWLWTTGGYYSALSLQIHYATLYLTSGESNPGYGCGIGFDRSAFSSYKDFVEAMAEYFGAITVSGTITDGNNNSNIITIA